MFTVIRALFLRETYTMYGTSKLGYVWALFRDVFSVGMMVAFRLVMGIQFEKGLHIVYFMLCGFFVYYMVTECVSRCMSAIRANASILSFPHVNPLDVMISRCLFSFFTNVQAAMVVVILAVLYGLDFGITIFGLFLYCIISALLLGFSFGILMAALAVIYPITEKVWMIVQRIGFFCSGVFFTIDRFPSKYAEILKYNPILQIIEGLRKSISHSVDLVSTLNINYVNSLILIFLTLGLLLQKVSQGRLDE